MKIKFFTSQLNSHKFISTMQAFNMKINAKISSNQIHFRVCMSAFDEIY